MFNKEKYLQEVENLVQTKNANKEDLLLLFAIVMEEDIKIDKAFLADKIVNNLFTNDYIKEPVISWMFFETEIGKAIIKAKFGYGEEKIYYVKDLERLTGKTRSYISQEMRDENIKFEKRDGKVIFKEKDVNEYLKRKGYGSIEEAKRKTYEQAKKEFEGGGYEREASYNINE